MLRFSTCRTLSVLLTGLSAPGVVLAQNIIRGSAQNRTRGQPAVSDDVILIRLDRVSNRGTQYQAEAHTKTDTRGAFLFQARYPDKPYLVRVVHQGVTYDQPASAGESLLISVFDAASKVQAITGSIEILRVGTGFADNQKLLHVSDMYELRNESRPPMTQTGVSTFDVYLPPNAKIDSVLAAGPSSARETGQDAVHERVGLMISAAPVPGEPGHYTVNFPLRPGVTRFAFNYDVPYQGHATFHTRHAYAFQQLAVMIPPTMHFSSPSSAFQRLATGNNEYQVQAAMQLKAGQGPAFEVSGNGPLPSLQAKSQAPTQSLILPNSTMVGSARALTASPPRSASLSEKTRSSWLWLAPTGCVVLVCALLVWGARNMRLGWRRGTSAEFEGPPKASTSFLESLKDELFQLEADRARGSISAEEYSSARLALEETLKRAVTRAPEPR